MTTTSASRAANPPASLKGPISAPTTLGERPIEPDPLAGRDISAIRVHLVRARRGVT
jgi:hypothetical protein